MMISREKMSSVDKAWLQMESSVNLMMITGILIFESPIDRIKLREILSARFLHFSRFKQNVLRDNGDAYWQDDPYFDIDNHLHSIGLPGKASQEDLHQLASDLSNTPLDFNKPLWQMHLIDNYQGGCAMVIRIHHCIADGLSLVRVMLSITDDKEAPLLQEKAKTEHEHPEADWLAPTRKLFHQVYHLGHEVLEEGKDLFQHPSHLLELAEKGLSVGSELSHIGLMQSDPLTCLKNKLSGRKQVAWAEPLSLEAVKTTSRRLGGTINDVLMSCATGALHRYLNEQQLEPGRQRHSIDLTDILHMVVPVNLRPLDKPISTLGNKFGLVLVSLPVGEPNLLQRFQKVRHSMEELKKSPQAKVFYGMLSVLGKGPSKLEQTALEVLSKNASAVMTNVPGPKKSLFLAGSRLTQPMVWVPQSGEVGVGLSILSYDGSIQFGLIADKAMIPDPDVVVDYFVQSYQEMETFETQ